MFPCSWLRSKGSGHTTKVNGEIAIAASETFDVEFKESFDWSNSDKYSRTLAGMANNRGGYILFGIFDSNRTIKGIRSGRMDKFDIAKLNQFVTHNFSRTLSVEKGEFEILSKTIGVLYVHQSDAKPIICKSAKGQLDSGGIYFRYSGETTLINEPELTAILEEKRQKDERRLVEMMNRLPISGAANSAILDLKSGEVGGASGSFLIDEELIDKINFISEGRFDETSGEPTLKLVGDLHPLSANTAIIKHEVIDSITERDIQNAFISQHCEFNPTAYIKAQVNLQPTWFPVFFFAKEARLSMRDLIEVINSASTDYPARAAAQEKRVREGSVPAGAPGFSSVEEYFEVLSTDEDPAIDDENTARSFLKVLRLATPGKVTFERCLFIAGKIWRKHHGKSAFVPYFRSALTTIDKEYIGNPLFYS